MRSKGLTYLRAPGKLIQVGVTVGQSLYREELDELRLAVVSQWPQIMRNRAEPARELSAAVEKSRHYPDGVICLFFQINHKGKPSVYVEYINVNLLDSMSEPALVENSRTQIPLFCWLLQKQLNGPTGWENLANSTILGGRPGVEGFGAARLHSTSSFAPWGSAIVTQGNLFPDLLTDPSMNEKDHPIFLQISKLFDQLERTGGEGDIPILWSQNSQHYEESNVNLVMAEDTGSAHRRTMLIAVAATVLCIFLASWLVSNSAHTDASPRVSGAPEVQREMKFFLWNRQPPKPEVRPFPVPAAAVKLPPAKKPDPAVDQAAELRAEQELRARQEEAAQRKADALRALGVGQTSDEEKKKSDALKALTNGR